MKSTELALALLLTSTGLGPTFAESSSPVIGESEHVYTLAVENTDVRGLAVDDNSSDGLRFSALDRSGKVYAYRLDPSAGTDFDGLEILQIYDLNAVAGHPELASPRGLAFAMENGRGVFYFLNWDNSEDAIQSQLWRYDVENATASCVDLSSYMFRIGDREVLDVAYEDGQILVSFDASGYSHQNLRVQRGIIRLEWNPTDHGKLAFVCHLPDSGTSPSHGLACMELDNARCLWATVGNDHIFCADARTGRGLFFFDRPQSDEESVSCWGMAFGDGALWISENVAGLDRVHRVNVTKNLDASLEGPRILRHLIMTIDTEPEADFDDPGAVCHYYSRPYGYEQLHNQGVWPQTETIEDISAAPNATLKSLTYDPASDISSRQYMSYVEYANAPAATYSSRYEIDLWTNPYKKFVYPHRVDECCEELKGTNYLADDTGLFNLSDTETYAAFVQRVKAHIEEKYGVAADMRNPYWAARNVVEYIQDHYYYPSRPKRIPAAVDYDRRHYDANPGNLKIELSARAYDKSQIIACSGTSVMVAGAMRHLGIHARWLGTGTQQGPTKWDDNGNGLLDAEEIAPCTNGHRYTQVWLGRHYGWICFDATPSKPEFNDYDPPPPLRSQWRYMNRTAGGHRTEKRIVFNVGSALYRPLYRDFEYDEKLAVDNNCGGDQRYNLQGRFEKPELWALARHGIKLRNLCFIKDVTISGPKDETRVAWELDGPWDKTPEATVSVHLQQMNADAEGPEDVARVAKAVPCESKSTVVDLSKHSGKRLRLIIRKDGDSETGGHSDEFDID